MSVIKNTNGVYGFSHRWRDRNGNVRRIKRENKDWSSREAKKQYEKFLVELSLEQDNGSNLTLSQVYDQYLEYKKKVVKHSTTYSMESFFKTHIITYFGKRKISSITAADIKKWQLTLLKMTSPDGVKYKNSSLKQFQVSFKTFLKYCVTEGLINDNPFKVDYIQHPNVNKEKMDFWTLDEFNRFISVVDDFRDKVMFMTFFYSGIRRGELEALKIKDFINGSALSITKTYDRAGHVTTTPKTANSYRTVFLDKVTSEHIQRLINTYQGLYGVTNDSYLFGLDKPVSSSGIRYRMENYCKKSGIKMIRMHDLRHSHVSLLINQGFSAFEIAERMGHTVTMVNEVYGHLYPNSQQKIVSKIDRLNSIENIESDTNLTRSELVS